jgi:hypothetical protein
MDWNEIEERKIEAGIALVVKRFPEGDRPALRAVLMRRVYAVRWAWVAARLGMDVGRVSRLAGRGRRVLDAAVERGRLEPEELEIALRVASSGA